MLSFIKDKLALWKFQRTPLAQALRSHTQEYFYSGHTLSDFSEANKYELINDFYQKAGQIMQTENPVLACRESLAEYTLSFSKLQVHCLTESEKAEMFYRENPYISSQIWRHIQESFEHNEELARFKLETPDISDEDLIRLANARCAVMLYYINGLNIVRRELGDYSEEKDWLQPFVEAALVCAESSLRMAINLPELVPGEWGPLHYQVFLEYVWTGEPDPFFKWTGEFPETYLAGEGPTPKLAHKSEL